MLGLVRNISSLGFAFQPGVWLYMISINIDNNILGQSSCPITVLAGTKLYLPHGHHLNDA
jgi:hypothetical protein